MKTFLIFKNFLKQKYIKIISASHAIKLSVERQKINYT